jgi:hypothetical protein
LLKYSVPESVKKDLSVLAMEKVKPPEKVKAKVMEWNHWELQQQGHLR